MNERIRVVWLLAIALSFSTGAVAWIATRSSSPSSEAVSPEGAVRRPAGSVQRPTPMTRRERARPQPPRDAVSASASTSKAERDRDPGSILDAVRPLPGEYAEKRRADLGGSLRAAVDQMLHPEWNWNNGGSPLSSVYWGWGLEGSRAVFEVAAIRLEEARDTRRGSILLALSDTAFRLGRMKAAAEHFVEAVLAMDPDWPWDRRGLPRLVFFAGGPNVDTWSATDFDRFRKGQPPLWARSGAGGWDGGSPIPWTNKGWGGEAFFLWVVKQTQRDDCPEVAMAATIWVHAVTSRHNWQTLPHKVPLAAAFRVNEGRTTPIAESATPAEWRAAFAGARDGAQWSQELAGIEARIAQCQRERPDPDSFLPSSADPVAIWSLSDEFARRFAKVDTPRADALRRLAAHLVAFDPPPAETK